MSRICILTAKCPEVCFGSILRAFLYIIPEKLMSVTLHASPLQGLTDFRFRNAFHKYFGGIDTFYAPYIRLNRKLEVKPAYERDIHPKNNVGIELVPQIMTKDEGEFLFVAKYVQQLGYTELNWNLGCPYPMVTKRGLGSGLIRDVTHVDGILKKVHTESDILVSIKIRLGYDSPEEILRILPVLDKYPLKGIGIHARLGKQLYKGAVDLVAFQNCIDNTRHTVYYNGDISSLADYHRMKVRFPGIEHWMIGRGLIADPFLPNMIKQNTAAYPADRIERFGKFHDTLFQEYVQVLSGPSHVILKLFQFWEYFITAFPNSPKGLKTIKKAKSIAAYEEAVRRILNAERS